MLLSGAEGNDAVHIAHQSPNHGQAEPDTFVQCRVQAHEAGARTAADALPKHRGQRRAKLPREQDVVCTEARTVERQVEQLTQVRWQPATPGPRSILGRDGGDDLGPVGTIGQECSEPRARRIARHEIDDEPQAVRGGHRTLTSTAVRLRARSRCASTRRLHKSSV